MKTDFLTESFTLRNLKGSRGKPHRGARCRSVGTFQPTAGDNTIDAYMILAAQALTFDVGVLVATTNVGHLSRFVSAEIWPNITSH